MARTRGVGNGEHAAAVAESHRLAQEALDRHVIGRPVFEAIVKGKLTLDDMWDAKIALIAANVDYEAAVFRGKIDCMESSGRDSKVATALIEALDKRFLLEGGAAERRVYFSKEPL